MSPPKPNAFLYDLDRWPLVITCDYGKSEQNQIRSFYEEMNVRLHQETRYYTISIVDYASVGSTAHNEIGGVWLRHNADQVNRLMIGATIVARSPVTRAAIQTYMLFNRMAGGKYTFVSSLMDAVQDAQAAFAREKIVLPAAPSGWPRVYL